MRKTPSCITTEMKLHHIRELVYAFVTHQSSALLLFCFVNSNYYSLSRWAQDLSTTISAVNFSTLSKLILIIGSLPFSLLMSSWAKFYIAPFYSFTYVKPLLLILQCHVLHLPVTSFSFVTFTSTMLYSGTSQQ